jgi:CDGSH-type Zn-finger protein
MTEPKVADTKPQVLKLAPGTYWWCACGRSDSQPFCDGSHAGTGIEPVEFSIEAERTVALCLCKRTGGRPFCDGSHSKL